jgi:hypothetical protein
MLQSELDSHIENEHPRQEGTSRHHEKVLVSLSGIRGTSSMKHAALNFGAINRPVKKK